MPDEDPDLERRQVEPFPRPVGGGPADAGPADDAPVAGTPKGPRRSGDAAFAPRPESRTGADPDASGSFAARRREARVDAAEDRVLRQKAIEAGAPLTSTGPSESADASGSFAARRREDRVDAAEDRVLRQKAVEESQLERAYEAWKRSQSVALGFLEEAGALFAFIGAFFRRFWRRPFEWRELLNQMDEAGSKSFLLVSVTGFAIGIVLAMQSRGTLARFGAEAVLPSMLALSVVKEIGPVITSVVLAGRLGAGFAAELGSMRVTEQIDALEAAALKPFHYLVVTRILACVIMFPLMTILVDVIALSGGYMESALTANMDWRIFLNTAFDSLRFADIIVDTLKTSIFGFIVGTVACFMGYTVRGGTREVGQAAMQAVVLSSLLIFIADVVVVRISIMFFGDISG